MSSLLSQLPVANGNYQNTNTIFPITEMATVSAKVNSILQMYLNMVGQMNEESMAFDDFPVGF